MANASHKETEFSSNDVHKSSQSKASAPEGPGSRHVFRAHWRRQSEFKLTKIIGWKAVYDKPCFSTKTADLENL